MLEIWISEASIKDKNPHLLIYLTNIEALVFARCYARC